MFFNIRYPWEDLSFESQINDVHSPEMTLSDEMRRLWMEHVFWTRMAIVSIVYGLPDEPYVVKRLLRNAPDMGKALEPFYGKKAAMLFSDLITQHLVIASEFVKAAKAGKDKVASAAEKKLFANADQISYVLHELNPEHWSQKEMKDMLYDHLKLLKQEAVYTIRNNHAEGVNIFDKVESQALGMADDLTNGIVAQFPNRF